MEKIKSILKMKYAKDAIILGLLVLFYSIMSFIHLGSTTNPQTFYSFSSGIDAVFELEKNTDISKIRYFLGDREGKFKLYGSTNKSDFEKIGELNGYTLSWNDINVNKQFLYLKITSSSGNIGEIQVYDRFSNKVKIVADYDEAEKMIDEPNTVPEEISYENSAYFDEVYFATSAHEYANGEPATEYTHPHLGKVLQTIPVKLFGTTPFTYRFMGNLAGIGIIIVMYILGKLIFKNRLFAFIPAFLMAFDNMHFAQTRIGTVDGFLILFCLTSTLFMYKYFTLERTAPLKKKLFNLFFCGLFLGCAICVKWMGFYTGLGLALLFFGKMIYDSIKERKFDKQNICIIFSCIVFFIIIPAIIYVTLYFNFETVHGKINTFEDFIKLNSDMFNFHSTLDATHPFSSKWYSWPIMLKPVWFYQHNVNEAITSTISNIGNPAIWWFSIIPLVFIAVRTIVKRRKEDIFILVMYLSVWLPYVFIGRVMFLYHYFMALPFVMFAITAFLKWLYEKFNKKWIIWGYLLIVFVMFWVFYPVSSGTPVPKTYVDSLHWLSTWYF